MNSKLVENEENLLIYKNEIDFYKLKEKTGNIIIFL